MHGVYKGRRMKGPRRATHRLNFGFRDRILVDLDSRQTRPWHVAEMSCHVLVCPFPPGG